MEVLYLLINFDDIINILLSDNQSIRVVKCRYEHFVLLPGLDLRVGPQQVEQRTTVEQLVLTD